jgi:hypothetical protein
MSVSRIMARVYGRHSAVEDASGEKKPAATGLTEKRDGQRCRLLLRA